MTHHADTLKGRTAQSGPIPEPQNRKEVKTLTVHDIIHGRYFLHHRAVKTGYLRQFIDRTHSQIEPYAGRFGKGFTLSYHKPGPGHNQRYIEYWVEKEKT